MATHATWGNTPLGPSGLVAFMPCGHWWAYSFSMSVAQMHALAGFNVGLTCGLCVADHQAATRPQARGTATRVN